MKNSEILIAAKSKIDTPDKWCFGAWALTEDGQHVPSLDPRAAKFCALSSFALIDVEWSNKELPKALLRDSIFEFMEENMSIVEFNDKRPHAEVMEAFDEAIRKAKSIEEHDETA